MKGGIFFYLINIKFQWLGVCVCMYVYVCVYPCVSVYVFMCVCMYWFARTPK